jgi:hypothetical protein
MYYFHESEHKDLDYALKSPISYSTMNDAIERCKLAGKRLKGWCRGLLEVETHLDQEFPAVQFLHRTLLDFLQTPEMTAFLKSKGPVQFSANLSIMKAYTAWSKSGLFMNARCPEDIDFDDDYRRTLASETRYSWVTTGLLSTANEIEQDTEQEHAPSQIQIAAFKHIDEFERTAVELEYQGHLKFLERPGRWAEDGKYAASLFRQNVFRHALVLYMSHRITNEPEFFSLHDMVHCIESWVQVDLTDPLYPRSERQLHKGVECILKFGQNPNKEPAPCDRSSSFLKTLMSRRNEADEEAYLVQLLMRMRLVSLLLKYGANPNVSLNANGWNLCRVMIAIPLKIESDWYDRDAYLRDLDSLFTYGADSEAKVLSGHGGLATPISAREWFFEEVQRPRLVDMDREIVGKVALRLLQRIKDESEADAAWMILKEALPRGIYERIKDSEAGSKRKRGEYEQQPGERTKKSTRGPLGW